MIKIWHENGIHVILDGIHVLMDPVEADRLNANLILVSHGHSDHASGLSKMFGKTIFMHPATFEYKKDVISSSNNVKLMREGDVIDVLGMKIEAQRSAHCIGSLQFRLKGKEGSVIFTGDLNLSGNNVEAPAPVLEGDHLIIESNFGHPDYVFPKRDEIYGKFINWIVNYKNSKPIVIFAHALGKTQEITALLNDNNLLGNGNTCNLFMSGRSLQTNVLFEKYRYRFNRRYRMYGSNITLKPQQFLLQPMIERISPVYLTRRKLDLGLKDVAFACVSGWTLKYSGNFNFPLSSHSGFDDLVKYVNKCGANNVHSFHGFSETFARHVSSMGMRSESLTVEDTPI